MDESSTSRNSPTALCSDYKNYFAQNSFTFINSPLKKSTNLSFPIVTTNLPSGFTFFLLSATLHSQSSSLGTWGNTFWNALKQFIWGDTVKNVKVNNVHDFYRGGKSSQEAGISINTSNDPFNAFK